MKKGGVFFQEPPKLYNTYQGVLGQSKSNPKPQNCILSTCSRNVGYCKLTLNLTHPCFKSEITYSSETKPGPKQRIYLSSASTYRLSQTPVNVLEVKTSHTDYCFLSKRFISESLRDSNTNTLCII